MSGKTTGLTDLELRKQLLVVESELNRVHLIEEARAVKQAIDGVLGQVASAVSMAESVTKIGTSVAGFFQGFSGPDGDEAARPSWLSKLFNGARAGFSLWKTMTADRR